MADRAQIGANPRLVLVAFVAVVVVSVLTLAVGYAATSPGAQAYHDNAKSWCDEHGGTLYNSQVIGHHGGLHCDLGDRTVHIHDVADAGWPENASAVPTH